ncbi:hypothetical protein AVEN_241677-1 [Araneus ventricosus]|uniref:Uncharacterized protein n=1 Tax=Araneus ventricosus TaxID=182803 RepID=A0A4Y2KEA7_ARAVE|nr:hypothetical protein AVEN_241677-1 [Araneus ventricosus]
MAIQNSNLPPSFVNEVVKIVEDETIARSNLKSVSDVYSWIEECGRTSDTKWNCRSSRPSGTRLVCCKSWCPKDCDQTFFSVGTVLFLWERGRFSLCIDAFFVSGVTIDAPFRPLQQYQTERNSLSLISQLMLFEVRNFCSEAPCHDDPSKAAIFNREFSVVRALICYLLSVVVLNIVILFC